MIQVTFTSFVPGMARPHLREESLVTFSQSLGIISFLGEFSITNHSRAICGCNTGNPCMHDDSTEKAQL